jgi:putative transposase
MAVKYTEPLLPNKIYHLFNHAVGDENLFRTKENYRFFLAKYSQYITPVARTFAYNLMPNHFHFAIQVRDEVALNTYYRELKEVSPDDEVSLVYPEFVIQQFSNLFNGYVKAFNKVFNRKGALLLDYMKRREVKNMNDLVNLIIYIHDNAAHHGFCKNGDEWEFSSHDTFLSNGKTKLDRDQVLKWFGGKDIFIKAHSDFKGNLNEDLEFLI